MSRKTVFKSVAAVILAVLFMAMSGCEHPNLADPFYLRAVSIENVPGSGETGIPLTLTATVRPTFASNTDIIWSVKEAGETGAVINGNILCASFDGTVVVTAIIPNGKAEGKDFTQDFTIAIDLSTADKIKEYTIEIYMRGHETGDTVTATPNKGVAGDTVTLTYTVTNSVHYNKLNFGGVTATIDPVEEAETSTRTYVIKPADSSNGVITITAVFTHTALIIDDIAFTDTAGHITKTYGDAAFTNAVTGTHSGSGAITYHSSDETIATVNSSGQVTIHKAGSAVISAEKAADAVYDHAQTTYTLTVAPKPVTITGLSASNKTYDGSPTATVAGTAVINGLIGSDTVTVNAGTASFASAAVGNGKTVIFSGYSLGGADAGNYSLSAQPASVTANITQKPVTISVTVNNKQYDGSPTATVTGAAVNGKEGTDDVTATAGTASFADKTVGSGKTVTFSGWSLSGTDAGNYSLSAQPASVTANITAKSVTITGLSASNKVYDGTTAATVTGTAVINGLVSGDTVTVVAGSASFASAAVGNNKTVTFSGWSLGGADAGNYTLSSQPASVQANITNPSVEVTVDWSGVSEWIVIGGNVQTAANVDRIFNAIGSYATYKWYLDGVLVGTSSSYTFNQPADVYMLTLVVTNSSGETRSGRCRVTVD